MSIYHEHLFPMLPDLCVILHDLSLVASPPWLYVVFILCTLVDLSAI